MCIMSVVILYSTHGNLIYYFPIYKYFMFEKNSFPLLLRGTTFDRVLKT